MNKQVVEAECYKELVDGAKCCEDVLSRLPKLKGKPYVILDEYQQTMIENSRAMIDSLKDEYDSFMGNTSWQALPDSPSKGELNARFYKIRIGIERLMISLPDEFCP